MLVTTQDSCSCRGCGVKIYAGERISWIEGTGPYHVHCSPLQEDKDHAAQEALSLKERIAEQHAQNERLDRYAKRRTYASRALDLLCFVAGPVLISANISEYLKAKIYDVPIYSGFYLKAGVGLLAIGFLRVYWSKKSMNNSR